MKLLILLFLAWPVNAYSAEQKDEAELANDCLADPVCSIEDVRKHFLKAVETPSVDVDCGWLMEDIVLPKDPKKAVTCNESRIHAPSADEPCPTMEYREHLAALYLGADGVAKDLAKAKSLVEPCDDYGDGRRILDLIAEQKKTGVVGKFDQCDDEGSTLGIENCASFKNGQQDRRDMVAIKKISAGLTPAQGKELKAEMKTWEAFVNLAVEFVGTGEGTIRRVYAASERTKKSEQRRRILQWLANYSPLPTSSEKSFAEQDQAMNKYYERAMKRAGGKEFREKLRNSQRAWLAYRNAAVTLYADIYGAKFDRKLIAADVKTRLTEIRNSEMKPQ